MTEYELQQLARQALRVADLKSFLAHIELLDGQFDKPTEEQILQGVVRLMEQTHAATAHNGTVTRFHRVLGGMITVTRIDGHKIHYAVSLSVNFSIIEFPYNPDCG
jgi:hypothetical protein